jgi:iron complex transport system permease protein
LNINNKTNSKLYKKAIFNLSDLTKFFVLVIILIIVILYSLSVGSISISNKDLIDFIFNSKNLNEETYFILSNIRAPRILLALLTGSSLAVSGLILQSVFRNPLADPFVIGISSGASLGAAIAIVLNINLHIFGLTSITLFAFVFAIISFMITYKISIRNNILSIERLLLGGLAISYLSSSLLSLLLSLKGEDAGNIIFWIMGSLSGKTWDELKVILPYFIFSNVILLFFLQKMNILVLGDDEAQSLGIDINLTQKILILITSFLSASIVSVTGVIGFIGIIIPQLSKLILKTSDYRKLYPFSLILGSLLLLTADTFSRTFILPQEIPVGIITSLIGVPVFVYLFSFQKHN